ncbi:MAG: PKD domain-containing protein, partial [Bacteroidetes bacterium]|nr:PKD domain-containing protein [Bacteroidota bacterium]
WSNGMTGTHISVTPVVTTNYSVYVSDVNGCTSYTATAHVFVYPPVTAALQDTVFDICPGNPVTVGINVSGGNSQYVYMIATEDSVFYAENNPFTIYPTETGDYTVTVADQCGSPQATGSFSVISHEAPEASVTFSTNRGCQPLTVQFNEFSPPEGQTYRWDFGDLSGNNISDERNPVHTYDHPGSYDVMLTITSSFGCQTAFPYNNLVSVYALPEASFSADRDIVMLVDPVVNFTDESVFGQTSSWDFGDGGTSDERNPAYFYGELGEYTVMLVETSQDGCTDTAYMDISVQGDLTFYAPDAFTPDDDGQNEEFFVYGVGIDPAHFYMVIYDRWGEVVFETRNPEKGWNGRCKGRKICKNGVYTWMVTFRDIWEVNTTKSGVVTLIR